MSDNLIDDLLAERDRYHAELKEARAEVERLTTELATANRFIDGMAESHEASDKACLEARAEVERLKEQIYTERREALEIDGDYHADFLALKAENERLHEALRGINIASVMLQTAGKYQDLKTGLEAIARIANEALEP